MYIKSFNIFKESVENKENKAFLADIEDIEEFLHNRGFEIDTTSSLRPNGDCYCLINFNNVRDGRISVNKLDSHMIYTYHTNNIFPDIQSNDKKDFLRRLQLKLKKI